MSAELSDGMKLQVFFQIAREKGNNYVTSKTRDELCIELIRSGIPFRVRAGVKLRIRAPLASMISGSEDGLAKVLGYSRSEFISHIESKFESGMTWDNRELWAIDHIRPVASFVRCGIFDPKVINRLSNLQPLWAKDNAKKSAKY